MFMLDCDNWGFPSDKEHGHFILLPFLLRLFTVAAYPGGSSCGSLFQFTSNTCHHLKSQLYILMWTCVMFLKWWSASKSSYSFIHVDTMIQVASSFSTEPSLDVVLSSIPAQIYEAIHLLKENMDTFTAKVSFILSQYLIRFGKQVRISEIHTVISYICWLCLQLKFRPTF